MIQRFRLSDLDRILEIEREAFPKSPYNRTTFVNLHWLYPESFLVYHEKTPPQDNTDIWGYVVASPQGHIISIAVHPARRKQGIGKEMLQTVTASLPVKRVWAEVRVSNRGAQDFYRRLGFKVIGLIPNYYGDEDALVIEKRL